MFKKILVGNDGSEGAKKALRTAINLPNAMELSCIPSLWKKTFRIMQRPWVKFWKPRQRKMVILRS